MVWRGSVVSTAVHILVIAVAVGFARVPDAPSPRAEGPALYVAPPVELPVGGPVGSRHGVAPPFAPPVDAGPGPITIDVAPGPPDLPTAHLDPRSFAQRCDSDCAGRVAGAGGVMTGGLEEAASAPQLISAPEPRYPDALRQASIPGSVTVEFVVDASGRVERGSVSVRSASDPRFIAPALESVDDERFSPGRRRGVPVRTRVRQVVRFDVI